MSSTSSDVTIAGIDNVWSDVAKGLDDVFGRVSMPAREYMTYYSKIYKYCTQQVQEDSDALGVSVYGKVKEYVNSKAASILELGKKKEGEDLLQWYNKDWTEYEFCSKVVDGIFSYLNRHFIGRMIDEQKELNFFVIQTLLLQMWKENLFHILGHRVTEAALEIIHRDRCGETIDKSLLKAILNSYVEIGFNDETKVDSNPNAKYLASYKEEAEERRLAVYKEQFQDLFIEATKEFYETEALEFLSTNTVVDYMKKVEKRLLEEDDRASFYLHSSSKNILIQSVEEVLITRRIELFQDQFGPLLEKMAKEDLGRMYSLCSRVDKGLENLRKALQNHIVRDGVAVIEKFELTADKEPKAYIEALLEVHERYSTLIKEAFNNEHGFLQSLDKAASVFINRNAVTVKNNKINAQKTPELLAKCCDGLLRKNSKMLDESQLETALERMVLIFKYIEDKDIFSKIYIRFFSRRLITETSSSEEAEVSLISKLKAMCGFEFTSRMTKMIGDIRTSGDFSAAFKEEFAKQSTDEGLPEFSTNVLSTGTWPAMPSVSICLPLKMAQSAELFIKYYTEKHTGRKLTWAFGQSRGEVAASCFSTKKIFMATCPQITILMQYNTATTYTFAQLVDASRMDKKNASLTVAALVKNELLKGEDLTTAEYSDDSKFDLNLSYRNKKVKVDLTKVVIRAVETKKDEDREMSRSVEEDRKSVIQACIVRILKTRKTISHQQLMLEVLEQLSARFKPRVDAVKKCIGILMEKEYLKRSDESRDVYEYIA